MLPGRKTQRNCMMEVGGMVAVGQSASTIGQSEIPFTMAWISTKAQKVLRNYLRLVRYWRCSAAAAGWFDRMISWIFPRENRESILKLSTDRKSSRSLQTWSLGSVCDQLAGDLCYHCGHLIITHLMLNFRLFSSKTAFIPV